MEELHSNTQKIALCLCWRSHCSRSWGFLSSFTNFFLPTYPENATHLKVGGLVHIWKCLVQPRSLQIPVCARLMEMFLLNFFRSIVPFQSGWRRWKRVKILGWNKYWPSNHLRDTFDTNLFPSPSPLFPFPQAEENLFHKVVYLIVTEHLPSQQSNASEHFIYWFSSHSWRSLVTKKCNLHRIDITANEMLDTLNGEKGSAENGVSLLLMYNLFPGIDDVLSIIFNIYSATHAYFPQTCFTNVSNSFKKKQNDELHQVTNGIFCTCNNGPSTLGWYDLLLKRSNTIHKSKYLHPFTIFFSWALSHEPK